MAGLSRGLDALAHALGRHELSADVRETDGRTWVEIGLGAERCFRLGTPDGEPVEMRYVDTARDPNDPGIVLRSAAIRHAPGAEERVARWAAPLARCRTDGIAAANVAVQYIAAEIRMAHHSHRGPANLEVPFRYANLDWRARIASDGRISMAWADQVVELPFHASELLGREGDFGSAVAALANARES